MQQTDTCNRGTSIAIDHTNNKFSSSAEGSSNIPSASGRSTIRKTPRQANQDRINAKAESFEFYKHYSGAAFKEATRLIASDCHDGTTKELINNLNLKYDLIANGKRKLTKKMELPRY